MVDHRIATKDDARYVVYRMWQRGEEEVQKYGFKDREDIIKYFLDKAKRHRYAFYHEGKPVAVFGAYEHEGVHYTIFMATEGFLAIGKAATLWLRRFIKQEADKIYNIRLELLTAVEHAEADRWFKLIGFHELVPEGVFRRYVYLAK